MDLNYLAFFLISFVPLAIAAIWYRPSGRVASLIGLEKIENFTVGKKIFLFLASLSIIYGYINMVIHQMGFYELFFTDIMKGSEEAQQIVDEFLAKYGRKHRHLGHGIFHGVINAVVLWVPIIGSYCILLNKSWKHFWVHFGYAFITSVVISGLIATFV